MLGENILTKTFKKSTRKKQANLTSNEDFYQRVEKKAYELFENNGCQHGRDWADWFEAERIIRTQSK